MTAAEIPSPQKTAAEVDRLILEGTDVERLTAVDDATFLRRVSLDLVGRPPTAGEVTAFGLNPSSEKRNAVAQRLLQTEEYAANWSRYWRDAILLRATNVRANLVTAAFEEWMTQNLSSNRSWDSVVTDLLTATGPVNNDGATALIFAHEGVPEEIAAEASRLFLGIQIQCANCHDHPWDSWKREQFHEFVAFFPRISVRRDPNSDRMFDYVIASVDRDRSRRRGVSQFLLTRLDRNRDQILSESEAKGTPLERLLTGAAMSYIDKDGDGRLSLEEIKTAQPPDNNRPGQGETEHYMADLSDPSSKGTLINPAFFLGGDSIRAAQSDQTRRKAIADLITSPENPWFARALVNRLWAELTGAPFYTPIDDLGPERNAEHEAALNVLCEGFVASGHDVRWLLTAITATTFYQRPVQTEADGFLRLEPTRLRSDQFYDALCQTLNVTALPLRFTGRRAPYMGRQDQGRIQFATTFGFDPSTPRDELTGNIPEALFMMNSPELHNFIRAESPNSTVARISRQVLSDEDMVRELYVTTVSREPTAREVEICLGYVSTAPSRREGFEDVLWSLLNSSEFQSKR
ncbi:MAG: DUF1549 domain-containing protein [Fuerstiella sp.]